MHDYLQDDYLQDRHVCPNKTFRDKTSETSGETSGKTSGTGIFHWVARSLGRYAPVPPEPALAHSERSGFAATICCVEFKAKL